MKKSFMIILFILCIELTLVPMVSTAAKSTSADTGSVTPAHERLTDGGYNIYCRSGEYVTVDTYPSLRSVQLAFPDAAHKVFHVENKGNNQITLSVEDPYSSTGYSYVGIDSSIKNGVALKLVDSPYLWNTYAEHDSDLIFSLRPPTDTNMFAGASGGKKEPRTKIILWTNTGMDAAKHGEFKFEPVASSVKTPIADDYSFANLTQTQGSVTPVRIEQKESKSTGKVTIKYNGSTTLPKKSGSYSVTFDVAAAPPAWKEVSGLTGGTLVIAPKPSTAKPVGQVISMGGIDWKVLDVQDGKALVLSELILESRSYNEDVTLLNEWVDSSLRAYLNGDFYNKTFSKKEKKRIVSATLVNNINPEYSNSLGTDTKDKIFLLSKEEVSRYFKDEESSIAYANRNSPAILKSNVNSFSDNSYDGVYQKYTPWHWFLRTPAWNNERGVSGVDRFGKNTTLSNNYDYGVRPAMWIKLDGGGFKKYKPLSFNKQPKFFTMEDMVLAIARDIIHEYNGDWVFNVGYGARGPAVEKAESSYDTIPPGYRYELYVFRMRCWGVLSTKNFDPLAKVTYGQFKDYLIKTMEWDKKYGAGGASAFTLTDKILAIAEKRAGITDTRAKAKPVKKEIERLCQEILYWLAAANDANTKRARIMDMPTKINYKVGEKFDITGLRTVTGSYGKEKNVNHKLAFTTSGVKLTPGYKFQTAGKKSITVAYGDQTLMTYQVIVE
ncbi:MAG: DUF6273 domain-containing protein [Herbinix sp.]|nr:DUF6273 domain-containing protein [Herbinix sp.]